MFKSRKKVGNLISDFFPTLFLPISRFSVLTLRSVTNILQMKKTFDYLRIHFTVWLLLIFLFLMSEQAKGASSHIFINLEPFEYRQEKEPDSQPRRLPGVYFWETNIDGISRSDIQGTIERFEIWNENQDSCIAAFLDEEDFIEYINQSTGDYWVHIITEKIIFVGHISIY